MPASFLDAAGLFENNTFAGAQTLAPSVLASAARTTLTITAPADTAITAATEVPSVQFNLSASRQWATGALTTQREFVVRGPTYRFVAASTITTAATLFVDGPPTAGTNATITNALAFWIGSGVARFDGQVSVGGNAAASAALTVTSTTQGVLFPRMTATQRDAIASPAAGLVVYNTTSGKLNVYTGAAWEAITSA